MTTPNTPDGYQPYPGAPQPSGPQQPPYQQPPYQQPAPPYQQQPYNQPPQYAPQPTPPQYPPQYAPQPTPQQYPQQPGYSAPPQGYAPPPPPTPAKRSNAVWITCSVIAIVVLLVCVGGGTAGYFYLKNVATGLSSTVGVSSVYLQLCVDESSQSYSNMYSLFSPTFQASITPAAFATRAAQIDTKDGTVTNCQTPRGVTPQVSGSTATVSLQVTRTIIHSGSLHLILKGSTWFVDQVDSSLDIT